MSLFRLTLGFCVVLLSASNVATAVADDKGTKTAKETASLAEAREDVHQALLAESLGNNDERAQRLQKAWLAAPDLAEANWHMVRVRVDGQWLPVAQIVNQAISDPSLAKYRELRDKASGSVKLLRDLARWCVKENRDDAARLHYAQLLSHSDADEEMRKEAIKKLDLRFAGGKWVTADDLKDQEEVARRIEDSLRKWRPRLKKLQVAIDGDDYGLRQRSIRELQAIEDPQQIAALESFLLDGGDRFCEEAARSLARLPQFEATQALVRFAVLSSYTGARDVAITELKKRPKHDFVPLLMSGLTEPMKSQYSINVGRNGTIQYTHAVVQENPYQRVVNVSKNIAMPVALRPLIGQFAPLTRVRERNLPFIFAEVTEAQNAALDVELQKNIANFQVNDSNRRVFQVLEETTGQTVPRQPSAWWDWWKQYNEYDWPKQTYCAYETTPCCYYAGTATTSCFVAGTLVRSETGVVPIGSLQAGDRVLAQDQDTGELVFKMVLRTTLRPPAAMVRLKAANEEIVTTLGHPFWVSGFGWKMAKQLKEGDLLHGLSGAVRLQSAEKLGKEERAHNLVVEGFNTYFVGQTGLLVHDNEFRKPTRAVVPGLTPEPQKVAAK